MDNNNGTFRCENCQIEELPSFDYRMILNVNLGDHSGSHWITCFQESGEKLMGVSSQILGELLENREMNQIDAKANAANFKTCVFRLKAKMEKFKVLILIFFITLLIMSLFKYCHTFFLDN